MSTSRPKTSADCKVSVTPPAICKSKTLRAELIRAFPNTVFNEKGRYLSESESIEFFEDADAALVGRDLISAKVLSALPRLRIVSKYGVGLDNIDREALERRQIALGWTPGGNKRSVAEVTLCFMLGLFHNIFREGAQLKRSGWREDGGRQITGKTVGIVGCGHIGQEVVRLLRPYDCRILVRDILDRQVFCRATGALESGFDDLIQQSDIVSLHVPLTPATRNMIDSSVLGRMKPDAYLVNTSRGKVVDPRALKSALLNGAIAGAALDVFAEEPPDDPELIALPNLMVTPHIAGNAVEAVEAMGRNAINHLLEFFEKQD